MLHSYIIHDPSRTDRDPYVKAILKLAPRTQVVPPVKNDSAMISCSLTHKLVLEDAATKLQPDECAWVMEDDVKLTQHFSPSRWLDFAIWLECNNTYGILTAGCAACNGERRITNNLAEVDGFSSTHCYLIRGDGIKEVLAQPTEQHFDGLLTRTKLRKVVTVPFLATQWPGHSAIRNHDVDDLATFAKFERQLLACVNA